MPSSKFHPLHPRNSLRKLRTALSSSPTSPRQTSTLSISSTSPLSASSRLSSFSFGNMSSLSIGSTSQRRQIRRKKSTVELEQEAEKILVADEILSLVEPRPSLGTAFGGIEEILEQGHV